MGNVVAIKVNNQEHQLTVREYRGQRVVTFRDIDTLHQRPEGTAGRNFRQNRQFFIECEDYYELNQPDEIRRLGLARPQGGVPEKVILLTESGYLMLVKSFTDDLAWQVQRQLVNVYFRAKNIARKVSGLDQRLIEARELNAKARWMNARRKDAELLLKAVNQQIGVLSREAVELLTINALEIITGPNTLPRPRVEKLYTAGEIAAEIGVSANKIGRLAMQNGLKTSEYGIVVLDKSPHSCKQVETFRYNEKGRQRLLELLRENQDKRR